MTTTRWDWNLSFKKIYIIKLFYLNFFILLFTLHDQSPGIALTPPTILLVEAAKGLRPQFAVLKDWEFKMPFIIFIILIMIF